MEEFGLGGLGISNMAISELPALRWHYDSVPFVCVTMLSDCTKMVGGDTAIRTGNGAVMKVRAPLR